MSKNMDQRLGQKGNLVKCQAVVEKFINHNPWTSFIK